MSFGKSSQTFTPEVTQEQKDMMKAQTEFFTGTLRPTYETAVRGATDLYNLNAPGVLNAAQNLAGVGRQAQAALGETGESALRTGITGLQSIFNPQYEQNQIMAALAPYRDWETDRKSTRLNSSHSRASRMPSSA